MARYSRRTARLLGAIEDAGAAVPEHLAGDDLPHFDFHPENVLVDASGAVTGVVDWDGASRSNGVLDLMTLRFDLAHRRSRSRRHRRRPAVAGLLGAHEPAPGRLVHP
jgi:Ser/Thr protein kinase RdoA (MazF antagonist)